MVSQFVSKIYAPSGRMEQGNAKQSIHQPGKTTLWISSGHWPVWQCLELLLRGWGEAQLLQFEVSQHTRNPDLPALPSLQIAFPKKIRLVQHGLRMFEDG